MSNRAKRILTFAVVCAEMLLPMSAALPTVLENESEIGCVTVKTIGEVELVENSDAASGQKFEFALDLGEGWVLRGIEIFDGAKNPIEFDITGIYQYNFVVPEGGARIFVRSEDHKTATRAECISALWELAEKPCVDFIMSYTDVSEEAEYAEAVRWAEFEGLISSGESFRPDEPITREELAVIVYRRALKMELYSDKDVCVLPESVDRDSVSEWALEAVCWNISNGIMNEFSGAAGYFMPQENVTRNELSEAVASLMKLSEPKEVAESSIESENFKKNVPTKIEKLFSAIGAN